MEDQCVMMMIIYPVGAYYGWIGLDTFSWIGSFEYQSENQWSNVTDKWSETFENQNNVYGGCDQCWVSLIDGAHVIKMRFPVFCFRHEQIVFQNLSTTHRGRRRDRGLFTKKGMVRSVQNKKQSTSTT